MPKQKTVLKRCSAGSCNFKKSFKNKLGERPEPVCEIVQKVEFSTDSQKRKVSKHTDTP